MIPWRTPCPLLQRPRIPMSVFWIGFSCKSTIRFFGEMMTRIESELFKIYLSSYIWYWLKPADNQLRGSYINSWKLPGFLMCSGNQYHPSVVAEVCWPESHSWLLEDMRLWLLGTKPKVNVAFMVKWSQKSNSNQVKGFLEIQSWAQSLWQSCVDVESQI